MKKKLCEIGEIIAGGTPSTKINEYWNGKISWITPKDLSNYKGRFISKGERSITEEGLNNSSAVLMPKNSILFTSRAPIGYVAIAEKELCTNQGFKSFVCDEQKCYYKYMYYWFLNNVETIKSKANGSTFQEVSGTVMKNIEIELPDMKTQKNIGNILDMIDRKIELNNRINSNLYNQMEALYKEYFIDNIKKEEWKRTNIYEIANIIYGAPFKSSLFNTNNEGIPIVRIRDLKNQEFKTYTTEKHPKGYLIQKGDIVVGMDGEFRPYIWGNDEAWLNQRVCVFENLREKGKAFLYYTIKPLLMNVEMTETATTVIHIGKNDFDKFEINLPPEELLIKYDTITIEMIKKIINNVSQNKILEKLRDTLLPKLMNGEIDLDNIEI